MISGMHRGDFRVFEHGHELDWMILVGSFQLKIFCDSLELFTGSHCAHGECFAQKFHVPTL